MPLVDLCTLPEVKEWANIPAGVGPQDSILQALIARVSANVRQYCSRDLDATLYTETYNGSGSSRLYLRNAPVTAVTSVTINASPVPLASSPVGSGYLFDNSSIYLIGFGYSNPVSGLGAGGGNFTRAFQNVTVVYTAGYVRNVNPTLDALPADLRQASIEMVLLKYRRRLHADKISETLASQNTQYLVDEYSAEIRGVLNRYRRVVPV